MDEELPLPDLHQATLDEATLEQLFFDIRHAAELLSVSLKGGEQARASGLDGADPLEQARELLRQGRVAGAQLRYRHDGRVWCDTLMNSPEGVRLVRIAL